MFGHGKTWLGSVIALVSLVTSLSFSYYLFFNM